MHGAWMGEGILPAATGRQAGLIRRCWVARSIHDAAGLIMTSKADCSGGEFSELLDPKTSFYEVLLRYVAIKLLPRWANNASGLTSHK